MRTKRLQFEDKILTIGEPFFNHIIEFHALFDKKYMSMGLQEEILRLLLGSRDSRLGNGEEVCNVGKFSLGELLTLKGRKGMLNLPVWPYQHLGNN